MYPPNHDPFPFIYLPSTYIVHHSYNLPILRKRRTRTYVYVPRTPTHLRTHVSTQTQRNACTTS
ncbi:hypothetical protein DM02DRAFT_615395 [Periconia macrospinosa]|uniref:Uncharacterized protein n=1 Tax=Periconia macrospinosa TaxID=97972 RepID=A0A2V1DLH0_9PLEO|nr:hypothetical protein DM02DRAFT_615395 [Periconia macrospinosa]